jgi:hypothetical protein
MKSFVYGLALIALLNAGRAEGQEKGPPKPHKKEIRLSYWIDDWMYIYDDGSGTVGFGAGGSYQVFFKAGTFDYDKVEKELRALKTSDKKDAEACYGFAFRDTQKKDDKPTVFLTADRDYISGLFQKGIESRDKSDERLEGYGPFLLGRLAAVRMADTWVIESAEHDGKPVAALKGVKVSISSPARELTFAETVDGKERKTRMVTASNLFRSANQFELEIYIGGASNSKRVKILGVYVLNGDELRIRRSGSPTTATGVIWDPKAEQPEGKQPKSLDAKDGVLLVLKRVTK